ncbi:MAG: hypothetical protein KME45_04875 [Stenomitos rutilans HA7619-LM2]|nr:hypothetical protein [Stenomitos rutilans HA7619-LM2]
MKKLTYGILSSLLILSVTVSVGATTPPAATIAQAKPLTIEQMFETQRVLSDEIQSTMAELKAMMAEIKALTAVPPGQNPTMADLYKQQQVIISQLEALNLSQTRIDSVLPKKRAATVQDVYQQQQALLTELKSMKAELKTMVETYRGRANLYKQ